MREIFFFLKEPNGNSGATSDSNQNENSLDGLKSRFELDLNRENCRL